MIIDSHCHLNMKDFIPDLSDIIRNANNNNINGMLTISTKIEEFKNLSNIEIEDYINKFNVLDKAGSYNVEDAQEYFIKNIDGCYNNIVGFPEKKFLKSKIKQILDTK